MPAPAPSPDGIIASSPRHDKVVRQFLADIGDDRIRETLEIATFNEPTDEPPSPMRQLLERWGDPTFDGHTLPTLMRQVGVTMPDFLVALRKRDYLMALAESSKHLGPALDGLGEAATPRWVICPRCAGEGEVVDERASGDAADDDLVMMKCFAAHGGCDGTGKVRQYGEFNLKAAGVLLAAHGIAGGGKGGSAGGGVMIDKLQVQQINASTSGDRRDPAKSIDVTATVQRMLEGGGA